MNGSPYFEQAELLLQSIAHVTADAGFALKGGTAIKLFVRDMPRLSVGIDPAYLPVEEPRVRALPRIGEAFAICGKVIRVHPRVL